jgi:hypothetical protein
MQHFFTSSSECFLNGVGSKLIDYKSKFNIETSAGDLAYAISFENAYKYNHTLNGITGEVHMCFFCEDRIIETRKFGSLDVNVSFYFI